MTEISKFIRAAKARLCATPDLDRSFVALREALAREIAQVHELRARGQSGLPEIAYADIARDAVPATAREAVARSGVALVRGVFPEAQARDWDAEIAAYIADNDANRLWRESRKTEKTPQIYPLYWSRPQVMARQAEAMARTRAFLNSFWHAEGPMGAEFTSDLDYTYVDRIRRRQPRDASLGLPPHVDTGSYERWVDPAYQAVYRAVFEGHWPHYDPWAAAHRTQVREYRSASVCYMFRTWQGWTALSPQRPGGGTLLIVPSLKAMPYLLLRALQADVAQDDLCGAQPGTSLRVLEAWHADVLAGYIPIPEMAPGDTIWWHGDVVHGVEAENTTDAWSNVIYIGAAPNCAKNEGAAARQAPAFLTGQTPPDFAPDHWEVNFAGRGTLADLSDLGRRQMGL